MCNQVQHSEENTGGLFTEEVELTGHIIDSLILPKVLDVIIASGGKFQIKQITIGQAANEPSYALLEVQAASEERLTEILVQISVHGAVVTAQEDCRVMKADREGAFPEGFYATTNQKSKVRIAGEWIEVERQEMDCGLVLDLETKSARCVPMCEVAFGEMVVVGHRGVRVVHDEKPESGHSFAFMNSAVSSEKPKGAAVRQIAQQLFEAKQKGEKTLLVGGPAIVHTGSGPTMCALIKKGYVDKLFAGNALATHDIEQAFFGTSLGVHLNDASLAEAGHEHHLRAINRIRRIGSIKKAVDAGELTSGIMYECVKNNVDFLLAGSIRDDGPLPDVITDVLVAQTEMRKRVQDVSFCLMIATTLHSIAVGNLLPAWVKVVCVDINPSTVIKLNDRGSFQTVGIVTDVEPFMRALLQEIESLENQQS